LIARKPDRDSLKSFICFQEEKDNPMATDTKEPEAGERTELAQFRRQDAAIAKLAEKYLPLKIAGLNDRGGFQAVHSARMIVKGKRVEIEKTRKELKADALEYGQQVDAEAKRLTALIEPIESHLEAEESAIENEKARLKKIEDDAKQAALQKRLDALAAVGEIANPILVANISESTFQEMLAKATAAHAERLRIAEEEAEAKRLAEESAAAERVRQEAELKAERERLAEIRRQQEAEGIKLRAEREKIEAEDRERRRERELEIAKAEAARQATAEAERRAAEKAASDKAAKEAAEAARLKAESERPYREQLNALADRVLALEIPSGPADKTVTAAITTAAKKIRDIAAGQL
jgi:hypothetical protein